VLPTTFHPHNAGGAFNYPPARALSQEAPAKPALAQSHLAESTLQWRLQTMTADRIRRGIAGPSLLAIVAATACVPQATVSYATRAAAADTLARQAINNERALKVADIPQNTVSVAPLAVLSADTSYASLGFGMASLLVSDLSKSASLTLVERLRIESVLRELQLAQSGRVDTLTAPRVGKLVGARRIVVGSIDLRTRNSVRVQSYVANTVTGKVGSSLDGSAPLTQIFDAEKSLAFRLFDVMGVTLTPVERRAVEQHATGSLVAFLAFSKGARAESFGDFPAAAASYAQAVQLDPNFTLASQRLSVLQTATSAATSVSALNSALLLSRASAMTADMINRPLPTTIGTGADIPVTARQQLVTFTVIVRTP
jgi:TolB-like protein